MGYFSQKRLVKRAQQLVSDLSGSERLLADGVISWSRSWYTNRRPMAFALTPQNLHFSQVEDPGMGLTGSLPLCLITWVSVPRSSPSAGAFCIEAQGSKEPMWIHVDDVVYAQAFLEPLISQTPSEYSVTLEGEAMTVEYRPARLGRPGGWYVRPDLASAHMKTRAVEIAQTAWRYGLESTRGQVTAVRAVSPESEKTAAYLFDSYLRPALGFRERAATVAQCPSGDQHIVALTEDGTFVTVQVHTPLDFRAEVAPVRTTCRLADVDARAGLWTQDAEYIFLKVPESGCVLRVGALNESELWRPLIGKAISAPGPGLMAF